MKRIVQSELLDELPAGDPRALRSRRDIGRINALMGNAGLVAAELKRAFARHLSIQIAEIGAGGGEFLLNVARRLQGPWRSLDFTIVDRVDVLKPRTRERFADMQCRLRSLNQDALHWLRNGAPERPDVIVANLFLHHFREADLRELLAGAARKTRMLVAVEPRRSKRALFLSRCLWLLGCNSITLHDAPVSVRAGFAGRELSALWPDTENWELTEHPAGWLSHLFVARRKERLATALFQPVVSAVFDRSAAADPTPAPASPKVPPRESG